ncbi:hypothetical protein [Serratia sp. 1D1416]|uniref:hypothetical protein n=1 Tax=Serratia sp. 1D1416 TaxID=2447890 RepID=UPI001013C414|nr:hypothetical protein [Serratia sp. 1D1416]
MKLVFEQYDPFKRAQRARYYRTEVHSLIYEVVENGPDATDYVVATFQDAPRKTYDSFYWAAEDRAKAEAYRLTEEHAYLGYGYTIRQREN